MINCVKEECLEDLNDRIFLFGIHFSRHNTFGDYRGLPLDVQLEILENVRSKIASIRGPPGSTLQKKLDDICCKNKGLRQLSDTDEAVLCHGSRVQVIPTNPSITSALKGPTSKSI